MSKSKDKQVKQQKAAIQSRPPGTTSNVPVFVENEAAKRQWEALMKSYDRVTKINAEEEQRLFNMAVGYIGGLTAIAAFTCATQS